MTHDAEANLGPPKPLGSVSVSPALKWGYSAFLQVPQVPHGLGRGGSRQG